MIHAARRAVAPLILSCVAWTAPLPAQETAAEVESAAEADTASRAQVLVLGTYHMANPGRDVFNTEADDVLVPKRQAEIAEVVEVLKRFRPTKIAVEADFNNDAVVRQYEQYRAGERELSRNEIDQIGYRLAADLGHETVYPVDVDGEFPWPRLVDYAEAHDLDEKFQALLKETEERVEAQSAYLASHTVLETLLYMNADERVAEDVGSYYRGVHFGEPWNWAGADLLTAWFERNIRIHSNVVDLVNSPEERILVIFGAGHLGWLRANVESDPTLRLRKLEEFVTDAS